MFEIIRRQGYHRKTIFCFSLYRNYDNTHDYQAMFKDIEVEVDGLGTPLNTVFKDIKDCVHDMEDDEIEFDELEEDVRLVFVKMEIPKKNKKIIPINDEKTFKSDTCMICLDKEPNVLFCTCGHISICTDCRENLNDKNKCVKL